MKTCTNCHQEKQLMEFYKDLTKKNGYRFVCKTCSKKYNQSKQGKIAQKHYYQTEKYKVAQKHYRQSKKGKTTYRKNMFRYSIRHPKQCKARSIVNNAITANSLPRPDLLSCHYCKARAQQYHHQNGYEPKYHLNIVPVCRKCHRKLHLKIAI